MFLNTERNNLEPPRRSRSSTLLLVVAAFLFSQSLAQAHMHVDGEITATCAVCHHADNSPALLAQVEKLQLNNLATYSADPCLEVTLPSQQRRDYVARAPPTIR